MPEGPGTRARAWPEGGMLAGRLRPERKMGGGGGERGREVLGEGDPSGEQSTLSSNLPPSRAPPAPYFSPKECHSPHPPVSLRGVDTWVVSGEAACLGLGPAVGPARLMTCPPSTPLSS